jgi:hypothetical protein
VKWRPYANYRIESGSPTVVMMSGYSRYLGLHLAELGPGWVIDDNRPSVGESCDRMTDIARYYRNQACSGDLGHAVDGDLKLAFEHSEICENLGETLNETVQKNRRAPIFASAQRVYGARLC